MFKKKNWVKKQLQAGKTIHALFSQTGSPTLAEAAVYAGWQVILIDNEHGFTDLETTIHLIRAIEGAGGQVILRVPWNDQVYLKRILDIGVQSLMIPMVNDRKAAIEAVAACRYPPQGQRGYAAPIVRASGYGADPDYGRNANDELLLLAQIEHRDACDNIAEIAAVDGIDMLFLGPNDLAASMHHFENMDHAEVIAAVDDIERSVAASGKMFGGFPLPIRSDNEAVQRGYRIIARQSDIWLFRTAAAEAAARIAS
jgi:4-hydroxy-2-oxoheptanedioate aldolase